MLNGCWWLKMCLSTQLYRHVQPKGGNVWMPGRAKPLIKLGPSGSFWVYICSPRRTACITRSSFFMFALFDFIWSASTPTARIPGSPSLAGAARLGPGTPFVLIIRRGYVEDILICGEYRCADRDNIQSAAIRSVTEGFRKKPRWRKRDEPDLVQISWLLRVCVSTAKHPFQSAYFDPNFFFAPSLLSE